MATPWKVPRDWEGEDVAVFASGPSMSAEIAHSLRGKIRTIAVNDQFRYAPWADVLYAADFQWWNNRGNADALDFAGLKVTVSSGTESAKVMLLNPGPEHGLSGQSDMLATCRNSGYQAMNLAVLFGAARIYMFGFDMRKIDGKHHNFGDHQHGLMQDAGLFPLWIRLITKSAPEFRRFGVEVFNCTQGSALRCFPFATLEDVHARLSVSA